MVAHLSYTHKPQQSLLPNIVYITMNVASSSSATLGHAACATQRRQTVRQLQRTAKTLLHLIGLETVVGGSHKSTDNCTTADCLTEDWTPADLLCPVCDLPNQCSVSPIGELSWCTTPRSTDVLPCAPPPQDVLLMNAHLCSMLMSLPSMEQQQMMYMNMVMQQTMQPTSSFSSFSPSDPGVPLDLSTNKRGVDEAKKTYSPRALDEAVREIRAGKLGTRRASLVYGIPRSTLRNKIYKMGSTHRDNCKRIKLTRSARSSESEVSDEEGERERDTIDAAIGSVLNGSSPSVASPEDAKKYSIDDRDDSDLSSSTAERRAGGGGGGGAPRPKRGQYRKYDKHSLDMAVNAVRLGTMSVHRAGTFYGVPHSTLEYKVKEKPTAAVNLCADVTEGTTAEGEAPSFWQQFPAFFAGIGKSSEANS